MFDLTLHDLPSAFQNTANTLKSYRPIDCPLLIDLSPLNIMILHYFVAIYHSIYYKKDDKKAVLLQGNRAMPQLFFSSTTFTASFRVAKL